MKHTAKIIAVFASICVLPNLSTAQELKAGISLNPTSVDPHYHNAAVNNFLRKHIFEALTKQDPDLAVQPDLAASWSLKDDKTWVFKLREGVTFSDGTPFDAKDVIYTICRVPLVKNSPGPFTSLIRGIRSIKAVTPHEIVIETNGPTPLLPSFLAPIGILSAKKYGGENAAYDPAGCANMGNLPESSDFSNPKNAIGTGPYKLVSYVRGERVLLERNPTYWGEKPYWQTADFRVITNQAARVVALLAGNVDLIDTPPARDLERIESAGFRVEKKSSARVMVLYMDQYGAPGWKTPGVTGVDRNPFLDRRVREALSIAIDRDAITQRIMGGAGIPAAETLPVPGRGTSPDRKPSAYNLERAKKLLAEAGFPNGFGVTLAATNDRYINDVQIAPAIAQMLARVGIKVDVDAAPLATIGAKSMQFEYSLVMMGWGNSVGEMDNSLIALVATPDKTTGYGFLNRGRYSNPKLDEILARAVKTMDDDARGKLLQQASALAMDDFAVIPLHFEVNMWATRKNLSLTPRRDALTLAFEIVPAKP